jgi:hypothetical protein
VALGVRLVSAAAVIDDFVVPLLCP